MVPRYPGGPLEECWAAPRELREMVNNLKILGKRTSEDRTLPECPDQMQDWVMEHKLRKVRTKREEVPVPAQQAVPL